MLQKLAQIINTPGDQVEGRFGPDQSGVISATTTVFSTSVAGLQLQFATPEFPAARYGKLGNIDRVTVASGHVDANPPDPPGSQQIDWSGGSVTSQRFAGITLDFTQPLLDKLNRTVPMNDCRKMYMVFAPRFEITEQELEDGCFLTASVGATDTVWQVDDSSQLFGGRHFIGAPTAEERVHLVSVDSPTQITGGSRRACFGTRIGLLAGGREQQLAQIANRRVFVRDQTLKCLRVSSAESSLR